MLAHMDHDFPPAIGQPATRALVGAGYRRLEDLRGIDPKALLALHGFGPKAGRLIKAALAEDDPTH